MAKKNLLAANMKRPSLKREMKVTEAKMDEVVRKVADNPPPAPKQEGRVGAKTTARSTSPAPAAAPKKAAPAKATAPQPKRGRPRKETASTASPRSVHPKEGTKRLTLDMPQELHKKLKLLAIHQEISMKDYIIGVVERSL